MYNSINFPNFVLSVPDIRVIGIDNDLLDETKKMLKSVRVLNSVLFQYDTTFTLCGFYVSILSYIHPLLCKANSNTSPVIPLAYFFHEKKYEKTHNEFFR